MKRWRYLKLSVGQLRINNFQLRYPQETACLLQGTLLELSLQSNIPPTGYICLTFNPESPTNKFAHCCCECYASVRLLIMNQFMQQNQSRGLCFHTSAPAVSNQPTSSNNRTSLSTIHFHIELFKIISGIIFVAYCLPVVLGHIHATQDTQDKIEFFCFGLIPLVLFMPISLFAIAYQMYLTLSSSGYPQQFLFLPWLIEIIQTLFLFPLGSRKHVYSRNRHFPWMTLVLAATYILFFHLAGPEGENIKNWNNYENRCQNSTLNFFNLMNQFFHKDYSHLRGNVRKWLSKFYSKSIDPILTQRFFCHFKLLFLAVGGFLTEFAYGTWRAYLPFLIATPFMGVMYDQCNTIGASGGLSILAGSFVATTVANLHWKENYDERNFFANISRTFFFVMLINGSSVWMEWLRQGERKYKVAHFGHASGNLLGFFGGLALIWSFNSPGRYIDNVGKAQTEQQSTDEKLFFFKSYFWTSVTGVTLTILYLVYGMYNRFP